LKVDPNSVSDSRAGRWTAVARAARATSAFRNAVAVSDEDRETPPGAQAVEDHLASALGVTPPAEPGAAGPRAWWRGLDPRTRKRLRNFAVAGVAFVILASVVLARFLQTENVERDADVAVLQAQARGDAAGMLSDLSGCAAKPACVAQVRANAANPRLRRNGEVKILLINSDTSYSPFGATGASRVAWTVIGKLPVVQCVQVHRTGNFLTGIHVHLLSISAPIGNEADC
jgi:hypothetical protein